MAIIETELNIEAQGSAYFVVNPTFSGQVYKLTFIWTQRSPDHLGSWYLDIDTTIFGLKIVNGIDILGSYHYMDALPAGKLGAYKNKGTDSKPGFLNFGIEKEITLLYEEP